MLFSQECVKICRSEQTWGLQNPGIDLFCKRDIPFLKQYDTKIIVNVCGKSTEDYCEVVERLADEPVDLLEINVSCPNVKLQKELRSLWHSRRLKILARLLGL